MSLNTQNNMRFCCI